MQSLALAALATVIIGAGAGLLFALTYPLMRPVLLRRSPRQRANALLGWSVAPLGAGLFFSVLLFIPTLLNRLGIPAGHCHNHAERLPHICFVHPLFSDSDSLPWYLFAVSMTLLASVLVTQGMHLYRIARLSATLRRASCEGKGAGYSHLPWEKPAVFTSGFWTPRIFFSKALLQAISADHLRVILAHEKSHAHRRDPLRQYLASALSFLLLPRTRRRLLEDLALATEQVCDEEAALETGSRLQVAEAILSVERLLRRWPMGSEPLRAGFVGNNSAQRIEALLSDGDYQEPPFPDWVLFSPPLAMTHFVMPGPLHYLTELFIRH